MPLVAHDLHCICLVYVSKLICTSYMALVCHDFHCKCLVYSSAFLCTPYRWPRSPRIHYSYASKLFSTLYMPLNSLSFCWICDLYVSKHFSAPSMPFFSLYFLLRLLFICWPHYVIDRPRSLFNMPFICIIALLYCLFAFSWPHFLLNNSSLVFLICLQLATFFIDFAFCMYQSSFVPLTSL